jgi:capsid protein
MTDTAHSSASTAARELASWQPVKGSADNDLLPELATIVSRSRDLARNHGVASGAIQTLNDNIVGVGLRLSAKPDYKLLGKTKEWEEQWQAKVEGLWRSWAETNACDAAKTLNFSGLTTLVFKSCLINGEALALPLWLKDRPFHTCIQLIEPDRLSNPNSATDSKTLRSGMEIDRYGIIFAKTTPEIIGLAVRLILGSVFRPIPISADGGCCISMILSVSDSIEVSRF